MRTAGTQPIHERIFFGMLNILLDSNRSGIKHGALQGAAALVEAGKQSRRDHGHMHLPALRIGLEQHVAEQTVGTVGHDESVIAA